MVRSNKNNKKEKTLIMKLFLCTIYIITITVLFVCSYQIFMQNKEIISWDEVTNVDEYAYIEVSKMSEKFAYYADEKKQIHFVIETEDTGQWHTYLIAIDEEEYEKYKPIIDYTYERTTTKPLPIKVYGYPVVINNELKQLAINNIKNFVPAENEVVITNDNFNDYLTNSYLDTTIAQKEEFNPILFTLLLLLSTMIGLLIYTINSKDSLYDKLENKMSNLKTKYLKK